MNEHDPHIGSSFESWLDDAGIREEVTAAAVNAMIVARLAAEMKTQRITKTRMAMLQRAALRGRYGSAV